MFKLFLIGRYSIADLKSFYIARLNRVLPLYWGVLVIVGLFIYGDFWKQGNQLNFVKIFTFTQYFDSKDTTDAVLSSYRFFSVTWSLVIEMQFYFIVPFITWIAMKIRHPVLNIILTLIVMLWAIFNPTATYFPVLNSVNIMGRSIIGYLPYFLVGGCAAQSLVYFSQLKKIATKLTFLLPLLIISLIVVPAYFRLYPATFNTYLVYIPIVFLIIIIFESFSFDLKPAKWSYTVIDIFNTKKFLEILGHLSFSIYLWHMFLIYQFGTFLSAVNFPGLSENSLLFFQTSVLFVAVVMVSLLSYNTIEKFKVFDTSKLTRIN
jgi:peptidoglycan/LPS O-acetylase OafA/YrhL